MSHCMGDSSYHASRSDLFRTGNRLSEGQTSSPRCLTSGAPEIMTASYYP
jgi:hypothetical protein